MKTFSVPQHIFRFKLISLILCAFLLAGLLGQPGSARAASDQPFVQLLNAGAQSIRLSAELPAPTASQVHIAGQPYIRLSGAGYVYSAVVGAPDLPVLRQDVEVPLGASLNLEVLSFKSTTTSLASYNLQGVIAPHQPSQPKCGEPIPPVTPDAALYSSNGIFPESVVRIADEYVVRGHRVLTLEFAAVRYNPAAGELELITAVDLRLKLEGSNMALTRSEAERLNSTRFNAIYAEKVLNYNQGKALPASKTGERYLIITADVYESGLADFVALKGSLGFDVSVASLTDVGGTTTTAIKNYITAQYTSPTPPVYVLLVGDYNDGIDSITNYQMTSSSKRTDLYYFTMDGTNDFVPDMLYGRFPVREVSHLSNMIAKYEAYEAASGAEAWVKKAAFLASDDSSFWPVAEATQNYVINTYTGPKGYTGIFPTNPTVGGDKLYAHTYGAGPTQVITSIDDDRVMVVYTGHGSSTSWAGPSLNQTQVRALTGVAVPYVGSHACVTADFTTDESFGDTWVIEPINGALTFVGASNNSYWDEDDILERVIFDTLYADPTGINIPSVGQFKHTGLAAVNTRYYWEEYHVFGDPSLVIVMGPKEPDFTLSVSPNELSTCNDGSPTADIIVGSLNDYNSVVTLSATDIPGFACSFSNNSLQAPYESVLTLEGAGTAPSGMSTVTITGISGLLTHSADLTVNVFVPLSQAPLKLNPADDAANVHVLPEFTWQAVDGAQSYHLEVATDLAFVNLVIDEAELTDTSFTAAIPLQTDTRFYWRVSVTNPCGTVLDTQVFGFRTAPGPGDCPEGTTPHVIYLNNFESGSGGWTDTSTGDYHWELSAVFSHSPAHAWHADAPAAIADQRLVSSAFSLPEGELPLSLSFWHRWTFDSPTVCSDGAILEISTNNGSTWSQVPAASLLTSPYTGSIRSGVFNPLAGKPAWCGVSDWTWTVVDLTGYEGDSVMFRLRQGTGNTGSADGWYVDDVRLQSCVAEPVITYPLYLPLITR